MGNMFYYKSEFQNTLDRLMCEYVVRITNTDVIDWFDYVAIRYVEHMRHNDIRLFYNMDFNTKSMSKKHIKNLILNNKNLEPQDTELYDIIMSSCYELEDITSKKLIEQLMKAKTYAGLQLWVLNNEG